GSAGPAAPLAELIPVATQLVAPVLALERPQLFVVRHLRRILLRLRAEGRAWSGRRQLTLTAGDLVREPQRLTEQLAERGALGVEPRDQLPPGSLQESAAGVTGERSHARDQGRAGNAMAKIRLTRRDVAV